MTEEPAVGVDRLGGRLGAVGVAPHGVLHELRRVEPDVDDRRRARQHHAVEVADGAHRVEPRRQVDQPCLAEPDRELVRAEHLADGHVAGLVQLRQRIAREARRLEDIGDDVAVRQLHALAHPGRAPVQAG
jgi:hypothetical protein